MVKLTLNGQPIELDADPAMPLLYAIREIAQLTGTKFGCGMGLCGACTVHLNGNAIRSCVTPLSAAESKQITTIEGLPLASAEGAVIAAEGSLTAAEGSLTAAEGSSATKGSSAEGSSISSEGSLTANEGSSFTAADSSLHPVQAAWIANKVPQCGYCQTGQIMSAVSLLNTNAAPSDQEIDTAMQGNICRCGTYPRIKKAIKEAATAIREKKS